MNKPIGVAEHRFTRQLPEEMAQALPAPADWERILGDSDPNINIENTGPEIIGPKDSEE